MEQEELLDKLDDCREWSGNASARETLDEGPPHSFATKDLRGAVLDRQYFYGLDFSQSRLHRASFVEAEFRRCNFDMASFNRADLSGAIFFGCSCRDTSFLRATLEGAEFTHSNLSSAGLNEAFLSEVSFEDCKLSSADFSGAHNAFSPSEFMSQNFIKVSAGFIVYKNFGLYRTAPDRWQVEERSIIEEVPNPDATTSCASGVNVATKEWLQKQYTQGQLPSTRTWRCLIKNRWLPGVVVPYGSTGKIRTEKLLLLNQVPLFEGGK